MKVNTIGITGLSKMQQSFVRDVTAGLSYAQAARRAGYKFPGHEGSALMRLPHVVAAITAERKKFEEKADMSRKKVMDGLMEVVEMAKTQGDAQGMVAGYREIIRICGYAAPEKKQIDVNVHGNVQMNRIEEMTDEELRQIIEGESTLVDDGDEDMIQLPSFPQPEIPDDTGADDVHATDVNPF